MAVTSKDHLLYSEFMEMMRGRRGAMMNDPRFKLSEIPMPELPTMLQSTPSGFPALVNGVKEPYFSSLNGTDVLVLPKTTLQKRQMGLDKKWRVGADGKPITTQVPVPQTSVAVSSTVKIGLKNSVPDGAGGFKPYTPSKGFKYVDYMKKGNVIRYIYIVPKTNVYRLNMCALILTPNKHRVFYSGCKLALQNGNYMYLYVIPFKKFDGGESLQSYRVLGLKASTNFSDEVTMILNLWTQFGVIFNPQMAEVDATQFKQSNLVLSPFEGVLADDDYVRVDKNLAESVSMDEVVF